MRVGVARIEIFIGDAGSLKEKRTVVKGLKERIRARFNVSVAEVGAEDKWQRSVLAVAAVSNEIRRLARDLDTVVDLVRHERKVEIIDHGLEII